MKKNTKTYNFSLKPRYIFINICLLFVITSFFQISIDNYTTRQFKVGVRTVYAEDKSIPWDASPKNWKNSPYNYDNSELNFKNSQSNYLNQKANVNRINIVNLLGIVTGYVVKKTDGGWNYFDNDGKRIGYSPDNGRTAYTVTGESTTFTLEDKK